jgi:hypothetical protein
VDVCLRAKYSETQVVSGLVLELHGVHSVIFEQSELVQDESAHESRGLKRYLGQQSHRALAPDEAASLVHCRLGVIDLSSCPCEALALSAT